MKEKIEKFYIVPVQEQELNKGLVWRIPNFKKELVIAAYGVFQIHLNNNNDK